MPLKRCTMQDPFSAMQRRWHSAPQLDRINAPPSNTKRIAVGFWERLLPMIQRLQLNTLERIDEERTDLPCRIIVDTKVHLMTPERSAKSNCRLCLRRTKRHLLLEIFLNGKRILDQPRHLLRFRLNEDALELALNARVGILEDPQPEWWLLRFKKKRELAFMLLCWHLMQDASA